MSRLPQPGSDQGQWGQILNDFLGQIHKSDGTLKPNVVDSTAIAPNAVNETSLGVTGGTDGQVLVKDGASTTGLAWATPSTSTVSDASTSTKGIVQLAGDLAGSANAPTVPGLASKVNSSQIGVANGVASLDATGKVPSAQLSVPFPVTTVAGRGGDVVLTKTDVALGNVDNTSDANKPVSSATQTALNAKANSSHAHVVADVTNLQTSLDAKADASAMATALSGKANTTHAHAISDVTGLQTAIDGKVDTGTLTTSLAGKANTTHTHAISDTTGLQTALDGKAAASHTHAAGDVTSGTFDYTLLPAGATLTVAKAAGVWPARPTSRTDIIVQWKGPDPSPSIVSSGTGGMMDNVDIRMVTP